jgi:hypothetical protein
MILHHIWIPQPPDCQSVVPRISMIKDATKMIQNLFPGIRIAVAHGRMGAGEIIIVEGPFLIICVLNVSYSHFILLYMVLVQVLLRQVLRNLQREILTYCWPP